MSQAGAASWLNGLASGNTGRYARASHDSLHPTPEGEENRTPPSVRRAAGRRHMPSIDASPDRSSATFRSGNEALYEAYNALHSLAQDFEKPFDAPAILVVGHQTDGKSGAPPALHSRTFVCASGCHRREAATRYAGLRTSNVQLELC